MKKTLLAILLVLTMVGPAFGWMLSWTANTEGDLLGYRVYRNDTADFTNVQIGLDYENNIADTTTADTCFALDTAGDAYTYFRITAVDTSLNESEFSDVVYFDPWSGVPAIPSGIQILDQTCTADITMDGTVDKYDYFAFRFVYKEEFGRTDCFTFEDCTLSEPDA